VRRGREKREEEREKREEEREREEEEDRGEKRLQARNIHGVRLRHEKCGEGRRE
jgi:hypothetical protein